MKLTVETLGKYLKTILIIAFILYIPCIIITPYLLKHNISITYSSIIIYPNGVLFSLIVINFIKLFTYLEKENPFTKEVTQILINTSIISFIISLVILIDLLLMIFIFKNTYINYVMFLFFLFILFFGVGIALYILSILFKRAKEYKEENELTI